MTLRTKDCQFDNFVVTGGTLMTTYGATSHDKVVKLTILIFCFQWTGQASSFYQMIVGLFG